MRLPGIRLVEQTEQKFRRFESVLKKGKKRATLLVGFFYLFIEAPTKNSFLSSGYFLFVNEGAPLCQESKTHS